MSDEDSVLKKSIPLSDSIPNSTNKINEGFVPEESIPSDCEDTPDDDNDDYFPELLMRPRGSLLTFSSTVVDPPATLLMGTDKYENDHLISQASERFVFFHVDNLPSAHVYLQLEDGEGLRDLPHALLHDAAQLCKANSSQGNKLANVVVMYTLGSNLHKARHMKAGEVGFFKEKDVHRILVTKRDDRVMNRLNLTKRKVVSARAEREKQQKALQRQQQKAKIKQE